MSRGRDVLIASIAVAAVSAFAVAAAVGVVQQDLAAYWVAGSVRRLGLDPYLNHAVAGTAPATLWDGSSFHHSRFLYPPLAAELFRPLAAMPYRAAKAIFTMASVAAWIAASLAVASGAARRHAAAVVLAAAALFFPLWLAIERGQIDLLLLLLVVLAWRARERAAVAGGLLALAAVFKPAVLGVLPALAAVGRWRWVGATAGWCAAAALATVAISGPALARAYATSVLPRAALYGEGGSDDMAYHERDIERVGSGDHGETQPIDGRAYRYALAPFDRPVSASVPRLLAPDAPSWPTSLAPYLAAAAGLVWAGRRTARRRAAGAGDRHGDDGAETLLFGSALVACVVTSPAGWTMGFVWALPMSPIVWAWARGAGGRARARTWILRAAWIACAVPPPFAGFSAIAGAALAAAAAAAAAGEPTGDASPEASAP